MPKYNFPEDMWQDVGDDDDVTFAMNLWTDDLNGNKYATFCPIILAANEDGTPSLNDEGVQYITTDTFSDDCTTYLLTEGYVKPEGWH